MFRRIYSPGRPAACAGRRRWAMMRAMTAGDEIEYRGLREGDLPSLARLLEAAFGHWPRLPVAADPVDHLRWKFFAHPNAPFPHAIAVLGDEVLGATLRLIEHARLAGERLAYASGSEIAVHPGHQGERIYRRLREVKWDAGEGTFKVQVGHTNNALIRSQQPKRRWTPVANETRMLAAPVARTAKRRPSDRSRTGHIPPRVVRLARFDERTDALFEEAAPRFSFIVERSQERMNWRYCDRRGGESVVLAAVEGDSIAGYAVVLLAGPRAFLEDILVRPGRDDALGQLAVAARQAATDARAKSIRCALTAVHPYRAALRAAGFREVSGRTALVYRGRGATAPQLAVFDDPSAAIHYPLGEIHLG